MIVNADLHIHSRFSAATSEKMNIRNISFVATRKGINLMATGDCLHSGWIKEIKTCDIIDDGTFELNGTRFILSTEVEDKQRVHHLLFFPCLSASDDFKERVKPKSKNIENDGRPNIAMGGDELAEQAKDVDALIGPAHAFTPWTALYASHNSLYDCYKDYTNYVSFVELGLSANTDLADRIQELHHLTFLTNSDCHSPHPVRLAREFNRFQVNDATYDEIRKAILRTGGNKPILNVGLPPEEGKYHESACRYCYKHFTMVEAKRRRWKCSCGKPIKKGVRDRIYEQADFPTPRHPIHRPPYIPLIPLAEIITKAVGQHNPFTQTVTKRWSELVDAFESEINVLLDAETTDIARVTAPAITEAIQAFRENNIIIHPGGGGQYGRIELPDKKEMITVTLGPKDKQTSLFDY